MTNFRFLSGVCAEHLQARVPIQLLNRNPHSSVSLCAFLWQQLLQQEPPRARTGFSVKEGSAGSRHYPLGGRRARLPGEEGRQSDSLQLPAARPLLSVPWVPASDSLWAAGQAVKRGVCEAFSFLMLYQAAKNSSIFSQRWCRSGEWKCELNS